jgi:excisionase family DNA binding protein
MSKRQEKAPPEPLMKAADVARLLGIVPRSVYFMVREGRIPGALHIGRRVRFEPAEVRRWLASLEADHDDEGGTGGLLEDDGSPTPGTPGSQWQRLASHEVIAGGGFWWRRSPPVDPDPQNSDPDPDVIDLCAGRGGKGGTIRLRVGQTVTVAWLSDLQSLLCAATVEGN